MMFGAGMTFGDRVTVGPRMTACGGGQLGSGSQTAAD